MTSLAYLHAHTAHSRGGGPDMPGAWVERAAALGYSAIALAERAPLTSLPGLTTTARKAGIAPIAGIEIDLLMPSSGSSKAGTAPAQPLLLLSVSPEGARNLA